MNSTRNYTLITGASTGIGYELAKLFAKDRHNLILVARDEGKLETAKNELSKCNVEVKILSLDLSKSEDIQGLFNYVEMNKLNVDIKTFKKLGVNLTCEPIYEQKKIYH